MSGVICVQALKIDTIQKYIEGIHIIKKKLSMKLQVELNFSINLSGHQESLCSALIFSKSLKSRVTSRVPVLRIVL